MDEKFTAFFNPIENLWKIIKAKPQSRKFGKISGLKEHMKTIWCTEIKEATCHALIDNMTRRIATALKDKGYPTKY